MSSNLARDQPSADDFAEAEVKSRRKTKSAPRKTKQTVVDAADADAVEDHPRAEDEVKSRRKTAKNEDAVKSRRKKKSPKKASPLRLSPQERNTLSEVVQRANANENEYPSDLPDLIPASPYVSPVLPASPHVSPVLPASPHVSSVLPASPYVSPAAAAAISEGRVLSNAQPTGEIHSTSSIHSASGEPIILSPELSSNTIPPDGRALSESESDLIPMNIEIGKEYKMKNVGFENMVPGEKYVIRHMRNIWLVDVTNIEIKESVVSFAPDHMEVTINFKCKLCNVTLNPDLKLVFNNVPDNEPNVGSYKMYKHTKTNNIDLGTHTFALSSAAVYSFDNEMEMPDRKLNDMNIKKYTTMYCSGQLSRLPKNLKDDIGKWDLKNVSDISYLFMNCIPDPKIESWDVKNITNMSYAFAFVNPKYNISLDLSSWDVSNVTNMKCMFMCCEIKISAIFSNSKNVRTMEYMFMGLTNLNKQLSLKNMDVNSVNNFKGMFNRTRMIKDIFKITGNSATNMSFMFYNSSFNSHVLDFNTENVTDMSHMFGASNYNKLINFDTKNVTEMAFMFNGAKYNHALNFDTRNVSNMHCMFRGSDFNSDINFTTTENVLNMDSMFETSKFNKPINFDTINVRSMKNMFLNARDFNSAINFTDTSNVTNMHGMFASAVRFNQPINFNTEQVTTMENMFFGATAFNKPVNFETRQVTNMDSMFKSAIAFNQNLNFDVQHVFTFKEMFANTLAFRGQINFINVQANANIEGMFNNSRLAEIGQVPQIFVPRPRTPVGPAPPRQPRVNAMQIHKEFRSVDSDQIPIVMYPLTGHDATHYNNYRTNWNSFIEMVSERFEQTLNNITVSNDRTNVDAMPQRDKDLLLQNFRLITRKLSMSRDIKVFAPLCAPFVDYMFLDKNREMQQSYVINYIKSNATAYENDLAQTNMGNISCAGGMMERFILEARELLVSIDTPEAKRIVKLIFNTGIRPVQEYFTDWTRDTFYNPDFVTQLPGDPDASESKKAAINEERLKFVRDNFINDAKAYYQTNDSLNKKTLDQINKFANTIDMSAMEMADLVLGGGRTRRRRIRRNRKTRRLHRRMSHR